MHPHPDTLARDTPTVILGCIFTQRKTHWDPHAGKVHKLSHTLYSHTLHRHTRTYSETHRKTVSHTGFKSEFGLKALTCAKPRAQYKATPSPLACNPCQQRPPFLPAREEKELVWLPLGVEQKSWRSWENIKLEREPMQPSCTYGEQFQTRIEEGKGWEGRIWRRLREVCRRGCLLPSPQDTSTTIINPD